MRRCCPTLATFLATPSPARDRAAGLGCIAAVATIWAGASFVVQDIEAAGVPAFALTYVANSLFTLYLPAYAALRAAAWRRWQARGGVAGVGVGSPPGSGRRPAPPKSPASDTGAELETIALVSGDGGGGEDGEPAPPSSYSPAHHHSGRPSPRRPPGAAPAPPPPAPCAPPSTPERSTLKAAALVAPLWFAAQLAFNASLARTSVTSNTILSSASGLFTYGLSVAFLGEPRTLGRLASVLACMGGTALVAGADALTGRAGRGGGGGEGGGGSAPSPSPSPSPAHGGLAGDVLALASSLLYACYTVALRKLLPEEGEGGHGASSSALTALFFGGVGVANLALGAPLLAAAAATGRLHRAGTPPGSPLFTPRLLGAVLAKGLLDNVLSDFLWARAVLLVGPTVATVGLNVQVPLAAALDAGLRSPGWAGSVGGGVMTGAGAVLVIGGVCGIARSPAGEVVDGVADAAAAVAEAEAGGGGEGGGGGGGPVTPGAVGAHPRRGASP